MTSKPKKNDKMSKTTEIAPSGKAVERSGVGKMFYLDDELARALDDFINDQELKPTQTSIFSQSLKEYLRARGYYPPKGKR